MDTNRYFEDLFDNRFTAKGYDPERKVSDRDFATIIHAAHMSPSSMGLEPWEFVRLKDPKIIAELMPHCWGAAEKVPGASHFVLLLGRTAHNFEPGSPYLKHIQGDVQGTPPEKLAAREEIFQNFIHNNMRLNSDREIEQWVRQQVYIALGNMLTTAAALGVDSTPIEGFDYEKVHSLLGKHGVYDPEQLKIAVMACFGYTNVPHRPKTRRPLNEVFREV